MNRNQIAYCASATLAVLSLPLLSGCGSSSHGGPLPPPTGGAVLQSIEYGRLVDVYAYRRVDEGRADRRDTRNRVPTLVQRNVLIRPDIETQSLFDSHGNARLDADFRFMPFDVDVGHEQLVILWDDRVPPEKDSFGLALQQATQGLPGLTAAHREQNTNERPIPVLPRNAALRLNFDRELGVSTDFFTANPNAVQVLEFLSVAGGAQERFRPVPVRVFAGGASILIDTSIIGGEASGGRNRPGLPPSLDDTTANLRLALPTVGVISKLIEFAEDPIPELNGVDARGDASVIRDFRSGNVKDAEVGALADVEKPMIVTHVEMGITGIDVAARVVTLNKRNHDVPLRGRIPYVDGALDRASGLAMGPTGMPTTVPLRSGDVVMQEVLSPSGERVLIRAEIVMNLDVGNTIDDPDFVGLGMYRTGREPTQPPDGGQDNVVRVQVTHVHARDSKGDRVEFQASGLPLGERCEVRAHYYENVPYTNAHSGALTKVSDRARIREFLNIDPAPPLLGQGRVFAPGKNVDPMAAVALRFSEPMDLETIDSLDNFVLTNSTIDDKLVEALLDHPKIGGLSLLATKLLDHSGDGTLVQLRPPLGHFHVKGTAQTNEEVYWCHMLLDDRSPRDMAGNPVDLFDRVFDPVDSFSVSYSMAPEAATNAVGSRVFRFVSQDEDGTRPGSEDMFGQFQLIDGELRALPATRISAVADQQILSGITRFDRGECDVPPATILVPAGGGVLYLCPSMVAGGGGGMTEPHSPRGSRMQMTYREDDFGLAYHDPAQQMLDVEQMHWSSWNDQAIRFDVFDRYTLRMSHSDKRPDMTYIVVAGPPPACVTDCNAGRSGLRTAFASNVLNGTAMETIFKDKVYEINPNDAFRASTGTKFVPYPKFDKTYTWRDPRLIRWNTNIDEAVGLGGAEQPTAPAAIRDVTAPISSPYVPDTPAAAYRPLHLGTGFVYDYGDYIGHRQRDHDPIALPLLMDFSMFPEGPENGGFANGTNLAHVALVGPCWPGGGYYNTASIPGCPTPWPETRAQASGGKDLITGLDILIEPEVQANAKTSNLTDSLLGNPANFFLFTAPAKDDHVHWAQADFVRRVNMVTYGFWDTSRPNAHGFKDGPDPFPELSWRGKDTPNGFPELGGLGDGVKDFVAIIDPPLSQQPVGTSVVVEYRGAKTFDNNSVLFDQNDDTTPSWTSVSVVKQRGNLLNPFYACEAYRYAMPNPFDPSFAYQPVHTAGWPQGPRVQATGLTNYVPEDRLDELRDLDGLLPRYMNFRIVMENNLVADPPLSPRLRSFAVAYRMGAK